MRRTRRPGDVPLALVALLFWWAASDSPGPAKTTRLRFEPPAETTTSSPTTTSSIPPPTTTPTTAEAPAPPSTVASRPAVRPARPAVAPTPPAPPATGATAVATFYDEGCCTASGESFDPGALTFAHLSMRFGTRVRFCHAGRCVVAKCNDRGPAAWTGATFDLTRAAFASIASTSAGRITVTWEVV